MSKFPEDFPNGQRLTQVDKIVYLDTKDISENMLGTRKDIGVGSSGLGSFIPSIYSGAKTATTTAVGEAVATGAQKIMATNEDNTNNVFIGFGNSQVEAETNASSGVPGVTQYLLLPKAILIEGLKGYSHYSWRSSAGSVTVRIVQGV